MKSKFAAFITICLLALVLTVPALAGGWATITLEALPAGAVAGEPLTIRFVVRQHGKTLLPGLTPTVSARNSDTGEAISEKATPVEGQPGHYEATLNFTASGTWEWSIQAFTMDQRMPDLVVAASTPKMGVAAPAPSILPVAAVITGLVVALVAAALAIRRKPRWALGLVVLGLLVGGAGLASAASKGGKSDLPANAGKAASMAETGQALFVAKGCVTCHVNNRIDSQYVDFRSDIGPNLSQYAASPEFLRMWLKDPSAVKPNTYMPNLELDEAEIEALVAFLSNNPNPAKPPATATPAVQQVVTATPLAGQSTGATPTRGTSAGKVAACSKLDRKQALLVSYTGDTHSYLALVDPASGDPLCGVERIDMSNFPVYTYAPGRSSLVAFSAETPAQRRWRLRWIDLQAWKVVDTGVVLDAWSQGVAVNPAQTQIAIAYARLSDDTEPKILGYNLLQVDTSGKNDKFETELDISPRLVAYSGDGKTILVYGVSYDYIKSTSTSRAKVRLYNATDLSLIWEPELKNVLEGLINNTGDEKKFEPDQMIQWEPALALSPDGGKLYIVHADADQLTTVDLVKHRWSTADIQPHLSWLDRLLRFTSTVAHAKALNGTIKYAALSPDGARLYVSGFTGQPKKDQQGNWQFDLLPFGLQVINTADGSEIARLRTGTTEIDLSTDGVTLFLRGFNNSKSWTDLLNAASLETIEHVDRQLLYSAQTLAGESLAVGGPDGQWTYQMHVFSDKKFSEISTIKGIGYRLSIP